jgi:putative transposase
MGRFARVVITDVPHHVTQRGNAKRSVLDRDADRSVYRELLREDCLTHKVALIGYCLMSNHVHLIAIPQTGVGLSEALKHAHGRYASYWNAAHRSSGHVWQGRFYSCPLDERHLWEALRYTELNPVRAGMVAKAQCWPWSSAASHCGAEHADPLLSLEKWQGRWTSAQWQDYLAVDEAESQLSTIRQHTHTGRPLGSAAFVRDLEAATHRQLAPQKRGPREKITIDHRQSQFSFEP